MKVKKLSSLAALASTALIAGSADAGLLSMDFVLVDATGGIDTYQLVGTFASSTDRVDSLAGTVANPWNLSIGGGGLVNVTDLAGGSGNADRPFTLNGAKDSYVTLGQTVYTFGPFAGGWSPDPFGIIGGELGAKLLADGLTSQTSTNVAFFQTGGVTVSTTDNFAADPTKMVFMQISVATGTGGSFAGNVTGLNNGELGNAYVDSFSAAFIPAPGALALLGFAGLIGTRRRRRA